MPPGNCEFPLSGNRPLAIAGMTRQRRNQNIENNPMQSRN
jgi:hypothetical protein